MKKDIKAYLNKDSHYFSESHLESYFENQYLGLTKKEVKHKLKTEHDNSCELENAEHELERELTEKEDAKVLKKFFKAVVRNIKFRRGIAIKYWNSIDKLNH